MRIPTKSACVAAMLALGSLAHAGFVSVYDYMNGLGGTYPAQTGNETWTFHYGDENGTLMPQYAGVGYGYGPSTYAQFTSPGPAGSSPGTAGTSDKEGIFTHTAPSGYVTAVMNVMTPLALNAISFDYEIVGNGNQGNGATLILRTIIGGVATDHGSAKISSSTSSTTSFNLGVSGLSFGAGDKIAVLFSNDGSYLYDHLWWNIAATERTNNPPPPPPTHGVPDAASTLGLAALVLAGLAALRRK